MEQFRSRRGKRHAQHQHVGTADLLDQLRNFGVFAAVVALLAYQEQNSAILFRLGLKQIDGGAYGIQNRSATIARLEVVERVVDGCAGMSVIANEMGSGVESQKGRLTARVAEKQVEERTELGQLVEFENAHSALFHCNHQRNRSGIHFLLYPDLLRHTVVFENKVALLQPVDNSATTFLNQCRHQHLGGRYAESGRVRLWGGHRPCLLYTSPSPRDRQKSRMPSSA